MTKVKTYSKAVAILFAMLMMFGTLFTTMSKVSAANVGKLNIHKLNKDGVAEGSQESDKTYYRNQADGMYYEYLAGAKYTVYKIGTFNEVNEGGTISTVFTADAKVIDLSGNTITLSSTTVPTDIDLEKSIAAELTGIETSATTAAGPLVIEAGLETNGVYLIVESMSLSGVSTGADFIITVPMYNVTESEWEYEVHAYPKNLSSGGAITKTITQIGGSDVEGDEGTFYANVDNTITYTVKITVPSDFATTEYTKFAIIDESSSALVVDKGSIVITKVVEAIDTPFVTEDYSVTDAISGTNNVFTILFTESGLEKIVADEELTITYQATLKKDAASLTQAFVNKARIDFAKGNSNGTIFPVGTDFLTTIKVYSYGVKKMNGDTDPSPLAGAEFILATKTDDAYQYLEYKSGTATWDVVANEDDAQVFETSTSGNKTDSEAIIQLKDLDPNKTYYLIEKNAPTGYIKLLNPIEIRATDETTEAVYNTYDAENKYNPDTGYTVKITNVLSTSVLGGGALPTTGGSGILIFLLVGAVLMGTAIVFYIKFIKKDKE